MVTKKLLLFFIILATCPTAFGMQPHPIKCDGSLNSQPAKRSSVTVEIAKHEDNVGDVFTPTVELVHHDQQAPEYHILSDIQDEPFTVKINTSDNRANDFFNAMVKQADADKRKNVYLKLTDLSGKVRYVKIKHDNLKQPQQLPTPNNQPPKDFLSLKPEEQRAFVKLLLDASIGSKDNNPKQSRAITVEHVNTIPFDKNFTVPYPQLDRFKKRMDCQSLRSEEEATLFYQSLPQEEARRVLETGYGKMCDQNKIAKDNYYSELSKTLISKLADLDPKDEKRTKELAMFVADSFYYCESNEFLGLDYNAFINKLTLDIRKQEHRSEGQKERDKKIDISDTLTGKATEITRIAGLLMDGDEKYRASIIEETEEINKNNSEQFSSYVKDSLKGSVQQVGLSLVMQETGVCIGLAIASFIDNPERRIANIEKDLNKKLLQQVQVNEKLLNEDTAKKTKTKEELSKAFKDLNERI